MLQIDYTDVGVEELIQTTEAMEGLFYKYHVNAAFSGHVHSYERFLPIFNNVTTNNFDEVAFGYVDLFLKSYSISFSPLAFLFFAVSMFV